MKSCNSIVKIILLALVLLCRANVNAQCNSSKVILGGDTLGLRNYNLNGLSLFIVDSLGSEIKSLPNGKFCFVDSTCRIRLIISVRKGKLVDTAFHYSSTGYLQGITIYVDSCLSKAYYFKGENILGAYFEYPNICDRTMQESYNFNTKGKVVQKITTIEQSPAKIESRRRKLKAANRAMNVDFSKYCLPRKDQIKYLE
jgi:hypothetical protein